MACDPWKNAGRPTFDAEAILAAMDPEPKRPCSSPEKVTNTIVFAWRSCESTLASSSTTEDCDPESLAPGASPSASERGRGIES